MNVSLNWAQDTSNVDITAIGAEQIVAKIGAQLGAVEDVVTWGPRYDGVIVARVVTCIKHPNADKLSVCTIDDGGAVQDIERDEQGYVQVVCGAPNVREGLVVAWLPPGSTVPNTVNDLEPFVLGARELRGVISNGMLASANELGISDNHDGLLEITANDVGEELIKPGTLFKNLYGLDDVVIDCENKMFTHRPDCFGILGVAREFAGVQNLAFESPDWYKHTPEFAGANDLPLTVTVESDLVPRFMAVAIKDVTIDPSPIYMQAALTRVGIRPINNIVDITNWLMHLTGQPLHAFDYDKVKATSDGTPTIMARQSVKDEQLALLNGKTVQLKDDASVVIATNTTAVAMGGVMGGAQTEVDANTKNIILEVATFDMYNVRKTAMKYGVFTDAVTRFNKGQSPLQNDRVIAKALQLVGELAGGIQASDVYDIQPHPLNTDNRKTAVSLSAINTILGADFTADQVANILQNVEFAYEGNDGDMLHFSVPFWRMDITITSFNAELSAVANADIAEEVGRLYGYDKLPVALPKRVARPAERNELLTIKAALRQKLSAMGANELVTYSFVHGDLLDKVGQNKQEAYQLSNALSPNLQYYRLSVIPSLLEKVYANVRAGYGEFALFEIAKTHNNTWVNDDGLPIEAERLAFVYVCDKKQAVTKQGAAYYWAKEYLTRLLNDFGVSVEYLAFDQVSDEVSGSQPVKPFLPGRSAFISVGDKEAEPLGIVGEFTTATIEALKLPKYSVGFEIDIVQLLRLKAQNNKYVALSKYPKVEQDISLRVASSVAYGDIVTILQTALGDKKPSNCYEQITPIDIYQSPDAPDVKHVTFRLEIASYDTTLKAEDVNSLLDSVANYAKEKIDAERL